MGIYQSPELKSQLSKSGLFGMLLPLFPRERAELFIGLAGTGKCCICGKADLPDNDFLFWSTFFDIVLDNEHETSGYPMAHKDCCYEYQSRVVWECCGKDISQDRKTSAVGRRKTVTFASDVSDPVAGRDSGITYTLAKILADLYLKWSSNKTKKVNLASRMPAEEVFLSMARYITRRNLLKEKDWKGILPLIGLPDSPEDQERFWEVVNRWWKQRHNMS